MQLFMEGPNDKCLILIEVENFGHDYNLPQVWLGITFQNSQVLLYRN